MPGPTSRPRASRTLLVPVCLALAVLLAGCGTNLFGTESNNLTVVTGTVTDAETGEALADVRIQERRTVETEGGQTEEFIDRTKTEANGVYSLTVLPNQEFERRWFKEGYEPRTFTLPDDADRTSSHAARLNVALNPETTSGP